MKISIIWIVIALALSSCVEPSKNSKRPIADPQSDQNGSDNAISNPAVFSALGAPIGSNNTVVLSIAVTGTNISAYRYKINVSSSIDCSNSSNYSPERSVATNISDSIGNLTNGPITLCIVGKNLDGNFDSFSLAKSYSWIKNTQPPPLAILSGQPVGSSIAPNLSISVSGTGVIAYRYKIGAAASTDCSDSTGYFAESSNSQLINQSTATLPDGPIRLCVVGKNSDNVYQTFSGATIANWTKSAVVTPVATLTGAPSGESAVSDISVTVGGTSIVSYRYKLGLASAIDCSNSVSYSGLIPISSPIQRSVSEFGYGQLRLCVVGTDSSNISQSFSSPTEATWIRPFNDALDISETSLSGNQGQLISITILSGNAPYTYPDPISGDTITIDPNSPSITLPINQGTFNITVSDGSSNTDTLTLNVSEAATIVVPNDVNFDLIWGLSTDGTDNGAYVIDNNVDANLPEAWRLVRDCSAIPIAVMDSGTDTSHVDLSDNLWINSGETPNDGIDNDNNGLIDDYYGYNFVSNNGNVSDTHFHGTHVAGTIAAHVNNTIGVAGTCWKAKIQTVKVLNQNGDGTLSDIFDGYDYTRTMGAKIVNNSFGVETSDTSIINNFAASISLLRNAGILVIAAAGNGGADGIGDDNDAISMLPANTPLDNVISVAALSGSSQLTTFSNFGENNVDIAAPGELIASTSPSVQTAYMQDPDGNPNTADDIQALYTYSSGTSMAAPYVAGGAAILMNYHRSETYLQIKNRLLNNADALPLLNNKVLSDGKLNIDASLRAP